MKFVFKIMRKMRQSPQLWKAGAALKLHPLAEPPQVSTVNQWRLTMLVLAESERASSSDLNVSDTCLAVSENK